MTIKYNNVYIKDAYTIASIYEKEGPIKAYFDEFYDKDFYYGMNTFEAAESKMLSDTIDKIIKKENVDLIISGDLQNQISGSNYAIKNKGIPYLGIFSACATFGEGISIGANYIESKKINNVLISTSSHNLVAEKQFRNPIEYGAPKKKTTTFTSTGAASMLLTNKKTNLKITSTTIGIPQDKNIKDVNHMGAVMAIAAANTIERHLKDLNITPSYYDLILTGDLGIYGKKILVDYLKQKGIDISKNYNDSGLIIYDIDKQPVYAGASGPACVALVTSSYIMKKMQKGDFKKVLIVPTGAIFSPTRIFQKESIPSIAHAFSIEVTK